MPIRYLLGLATCFGVLASLLAAPARIRADAQDPPDDEDKAPTTKISLQARSAPRPALRYRLLPTLIDLKPGNAAVYYNKAALMYAQSGDQFKELQKLDGWMQLPLDKFPHADVAEYLARYEQVLREVGFAAHREQCDWQMPLREQMPYAIMLPELQETRNLGRLVALQARLQTAQGKLDDALNSLKLGYAMARHAAFGPTLIHGLVGLAIANMMTNQALELTQQAESPNLYWAFTTLPRPFISLKRANEFEADSIYFWHPEWRDRAHEFFSPAEWQRMYETMAGGMGELDSAWSGDSGRLRLVGRAVKGFPEAKRWLIDHGRSADAVEAMPVAQVVVLYSLDVYEELRDEVFKWAGLSYWQLSDSHRKDNETGHHDDTYREIIPLAQTLLPGIRNVALSQGRTERLLCLARIVEALRLYAASHDGRLPAQLGDISEAPVPLDPLTGRPFSYHLAGKMAVIETPLPAELSPRQFGLRYEVTVNKYQR